MTDPAEVAAAMAAAYRDEQARAEAGEAVNSQPPPAPAQEPLIRPLLVSVVPPVVPLSPEEKPWQP